MNAYAAVFHRLRRHREFPPCCCSGSWRASKPHKAGINPANRTELSAIALRRAPRLWAKLIKSVATWAKP